MPERGGHSSANVLLRMPAASMSACTAQACTRLPPACCTGVSSTNAPSMADPVSSWNSRLAAASGASPSSISPLAIDHEPRSRFFQYGPPGCTRKTSRTPSLKRYGSNPALVFVAIRIRSFRRVRGRAGLRSQFTQRRERPAENFLVVIDRVDHIGRHEELGRIANPMQSLGLDLGSHNPQRKVA